MATDPYPPSASSHGGPSPLHAPTTSPRPRHHFFSIMAARHSVSISWWWRRWMESHGDALNEQRGRCTVFIPSKGKSRFQGSRLRLIRRFYWNLLPRPALEAASTAPNAEQSRTGVVRRARLYLAGRASVAYGEAEGPICMDWARTSMADPFQSSARITEVQGSHSHLGRRQKRSLIRIATSGRGRSCASGPICKCSIRGRGTG